MDIDIQKLKYFVAVYEERNITKAAERCYISQPALSAIIQRLENTLGVTLFTRNKKGVIPTENAHRFYKHAKDLIENYNKTFSYLKSEALKRTISIGIIPTIKADIIYNIVNNLRINKDNIEIKLVNLHEEADFKIISDIYTDRQETFIPVWKEDMVLAVPISSPFALREKITLKDLEDIPFIDRENCEYYEDFQNLLKEKTIKLNVVAKVSSEEVAASLVSCGLGACILPKMSVENVAGVSIKRIDGMSCYRVVGIGVRSREQYVRDLVVDVVNHLRCIIPKNYLILDGFFEYGRCETTS